jgi:hypothetical protein
MKRWLAATCAALAVSSGAYATDIGITVEVSQPGVYGRIDVGRFPQPAVIVPQPVIITPPPPGVVVQPIYMWVPYGHRKDWARHCHRYGACGYPVYFVRHDWYDRHVRHGDDRRGRDDEDRGRGKGKGKGKGRD